MASIEEITNSHEFGNILTRVAGEHGSEVVDVILENEETTDEEIANETGIRLNLVRKILYDLYDSRVLDYRRTRDDSTGWYSYHWRVEPEEAIELMNEDKQTLLEKLKGRLEQERSTLYFTCGKQCPRVSFGEAMDNDFQCPECGDKMEEFDNSKIIESLENQIKSLEEELSEKEEETAEAEEEEETGN